jgi:tetraacyldisaccharide 4'-kinase
VSPLSFLYGAATRLRNDLYDRDLLKQRRLGKPVVSVGNLSVGGSGKTPFVILLGELLKARNVSFDVLSRGYGRRTRGVLVVDPNGSAERFGDEPLLIARSLRCPVVVGEDRYEAGVLAEERLPTQVHILDDGFQHRSLARDFDIVLLTPADVHDHLLPQGRLREPLSSLRRTHVVVLIGDVEGRARALPKLDAQIWKIRRGVALENAPEKPVVFCGIARPRAFLEQLHELGVRESATKFYRDHNRYSERELNDLLKLRKQSSAGGFITTEKDAVNLGPLLSRLGEVSIARVTMELEQPDAALDTLLRVIAERKGSA